MVINHQAAIVIDLLMVISGNVVIIPQSFTKSFGINEFHLVSERRLFYYSPLF